MGNKKRKIIHPVKTLTSNTEVDTEIINDGTINKVIIYTPKSTNEEGISLALLKAFKEGVSLLKDKKTTEISAGINAKLTDNGKSMTFQTYLLPNRTSILAHPKTLKANSNGSPYSVLYNTGVDQKLHEAIFNKPNSPGFFIELFPGNGIENSHCKFFEEFLGWSGYNIEPDKKLFNNLTKNRNNRSINLNFNICGKEKEDLVSSFSLESFLKRENLNCIDLLSINTTLNEAPDDKLNILLGLNPSALPKCITIDFKVGNLIKINKFLKKFNYTQSCIYKTSAVFTTKV